jgi:hypothetical protein
VRTTTLIAICFMLTSVLLVRLAATGGSVTGSRSDITEGLNLEALGVKPSAPSPAAPQAAASEAVAKDAGVMAGGMVTGAGVPAQAPAQPVK